MAEAGLESTGGRVVHAEGDRSLRREVYSKLAERGDVELESVASLARLEAELSAGRVECVVTGSELEDGDWRDLTEAVREFDPDLPVVFYPAEPDPEVAGEVTEVGVSEFLPRPLDEDGEGLRARIRSAIERYRRLRTLRRQSNRYEEIMETLPLSVYFKDEDARYVHTSAKLADDSDTDFVGKTDPDIWGNPENPTALETYRDDKRVIEAGESIEAKEEYHKLEDNDLWVRSYKYPWRGEDGEIRGLLGMTRNVTDQKEREKDLKQKSQRLEQFASFVSHDLRNPINIAQGYLDRARETGDEAAFQEVEDALERMETLIDDLLSTVRRGDATREWVEFRPLVERVWTATETQDVDLEIDIPEGTSIAAVPGQLRQVLDNLFRNVDEHAGAGATVTVGTTDVGFYVEDDGVGIDPDRRETVFEYGVTDGGTGIGLAIVSEVAESNDWTIDLVESEDGGARFEFGHCALRSVGLESLSPAEEIQIDETMDLGDPSPPSHFERSEGGDAWTVEAGGRNIWDGIEEHFFAYGTVEGDARIVARVADLEDVDEYSKAGIMVRDWPDTGSPLGYVGATPGHGTETVFRTFPEEDIDSNQSIDVGGAPRWYRIDWIDDSATFYTSADGDEWTAVDRRSISSHGPVSVGIAVCGIEPECSVRAVFEDVRAVRLTPDDAAD